MKVVAVIPAYNEEKTIAEIVRVVKQVPLVEETLVVSDGSVDKTAEAARQAGARVIELSKNRGKGGAMMHGVKKSEGDVLIFLDADLLGLTPFHITDLLEPVLKGEAEMTVGIFGHGRFATDLAQFVAPYLSGQRAVKREVLEGMSDLDLARFGVEVALTKYAKRIGMSVKEVELLDMSHIMKEEKLGFVRGFMARIKMYWEIAKVVGKG